MSVCGRKGCENKMKRVYIAIAFLLVAFCIASAEMGYVSAKADMFVYKIENADKHMRKSEFSEAIKICKKTESEWYESADIIDMLLIHDYVDSIGISISQMRSYAESKNADLYFAQSTSAKKELASIKESEYPLIENLL